MRNVFLSNINFAIFGELQELHHILNWPVFGIGFKAINSALFTANNKLRFFAILN